MPKFLTILILLLFGVNVNSQNCHQSNSTSFVNDCDECVFEYDNFAENCVDLESVCKSDTTHIYINNSLAFSASDSLPEAVRTQIEADFCVHDGEIIDCYCTLLPELETYIIEHKFTQNGIVNNSTILDFINFEDDYLRVVVAIDSASSEGSLNYEIVLEREVIMNCYMCNDLVCFDQNIGIPVEESFEITMNLKECEEEQAISSSNANIFTETISIFPNPASNFIKIENVNEPFQLSIFDVSGKMIGKYNNQNNVEIQELKSGLYFIQITTENYTVQKEFIKL